MKGGAVCRVRRAAPDVAQRFEADGWIVVGSTPEQFRAVIRADLEKWTKVTKDIGLVLD